MGRSIKKGPYVDANLEEKIVAINDGKTKPGAVVAQLLLISLDTLLQYTTETSSSLFM